MKYRLLYTFIMLPVFIYGQDIRFDHLDIKDGLSQNSAFAMDMDANGYIWIGTLNGLNRYDGYSFETFKPIINKPGSTQGSLFRVLSCDKKGHVWALTQDGGLTKYDYLQQTFINYSDSLFGNYNPKNYNFIKVDNSSWVWMATTDQLIGFNPADSTLINPIIEHNISGISLLPNGNIGVYGNFGLYEMYLSIDSTYIPVLRMDEEVRGIGFEGGKMVVMHQSSLAIYGKDYTKPIDRYYLKSIKNSPLNIVEPVLLVDSTNVWIAGDNTLLKYEIHEKEIVCHRYKYDPDDPNSFRGYHIQNIIKDKNGNVWIGTSKHGINIISKSKNSFQHFSWKYSNYKNLEIDPVRAICLSSENHYWLGFDRVGVGIIHPNGKQTLKTTYLDDEGRARLIKNVRSIFEDNDKNIWIGMFAGICIYNRETDNLEHISRFIEGQWKNRSYLTKQYDKDRVVLATGRTLAIIDLKDKTHEVYPSKGNKYIIASNIRDFDIKDSIIWLGLDNSGIAMINTQTKETVHFNPEKIGLSNAKVYSVRIIGNDLWIATNNGLNRFNTKTKEVEEVFYEENGLSNNIVYSLNVDVNNNLWMSTNRGISKLKTSNKLFTSYLKSDFFMDDASFQSKDGRIYFGGYTGIVHFNPVEIEGKQQLKPPYIESFSLNNEVVKPAEIIGNRILLHNHINRSKVIYLKHFENTFSLSFNALQFDIPNNNKFRYRLVNWQNEWIKLEGNSRSVTFTKVRPGNYTFLLSVAGSNENWSPTKSITIVITPPFWSKLWFRLMMLAFIFIVLVAIYRWRVYRIQQRNRLLKQKVDEQTQDIIKKSDEIKSISEKLHEADEAKLRFFTNISHEFRTPLTLILGYLEELDDNKSRSVKSVIQNNAIRLLRLVNQLIEFRKLDQDQLKLEVSYFEFNSFVNETVNSFQKLAKQKNIQLTFEPHENRISAWLDMDKTEKILFNLISNAIKYTPENNLIVVATLEDEDHFYVRITDYGIGISKEELPHVFDRFFRSKNTNEVGHGIGLSLAKGLAEMQHGSLLVSSQKGKGSVFTGQFKKGRNHFKENEITTREVKPLVPKEILTPVSPYLSQKKVLEKRVLLVEDDHELQDYLADILSELYVVSKARDGFEAMELLEHIYPDLIISDIMMPRMDGITFCKKVKENELTAKIPFILLTAKTDSITRIEGFKIGIDDYIEKPFDKRVLIERVRALLNNRDQLNRAPIESKTIAQIDRSKFSKDDVRFWKKVNMIINRNLNNVNFTTEVLSEKMNMSRSTFYRKFKGLCGENAADYIRKIRLHKAAELLQKKEHNIQQISLEVGFQSTAHFRVKFKAYFGINPSEYV